MKRIKLLISILTVIVCILFGCSKKETVSLTELMPEEKQQEAEEQVPQEASTPAEMPEQPEIPQETPEAGEEKLAVHICGAVANPGVYELPQGSRLYQAVEAAGGFTQEAQQDFLNQAESLQDGSRIYVPTTEEAMEALKEGEQSFITGGVQTEENGGKAESAGNGFVNINTASEAELCTLAGIGSTKAKSIIAYRTENGNFNKIEDIMNVDGIKDALFQKIRDSITV